MIVFILSNKNQL